MGQIPGLERSPGEENDDMLEYSCLGNSMDRGAWWATVRAYVHAKPLYSCLTLCDPMDYSPPGSSDHRNHDPGKNTGLGFHTFLQLVFLTQGLNPRLLYLLHWQVGS